MATDVTNSGLQLLNVIVERDMAHCTARAWRCAHVAACRSVSNTASGRNIVFPSFQCLGHCFKVVSLGKVLHPQMLHLTR